MAVLEAALAVPGSRLPKPSCRGCGGCASSRLDHGFPDGRHHRRSYNDSPFARMYCYIAASRNGFYEVVSGGDTRHQGKAITLKSKMESVVDFESEIMNFEFKIQEVWIALFRCPKNHGYPPEAVCGSKVSCFQSNPTPSRSNPDPI